MEKILLIDDDEVIAKIITYYLAKENRYTVSWAKNAGEGLAACKNGFDLILLDVKLPDVDGVSLCASLRQYVDCPILLISCIDDEKVIIEALRNGGDDYIVKPFDCDVLIARIEANLRRAAMGKRTGEREQAVVRQPGFSVDEVRRCIVRGGKEFRLTPTEYELLQYFLSHDNQPAALEEIYQNIWPGQAYNDMRALVVHISNLRKKLGDCENGMRYLHNIRGVGYYYHPVREEA